LAEVWRPPAKAAQNLLEGLRTAYHDVEDHDGHHGDDDADERVGELAEALDGIDELGGVGLAGGFPDGHAFIDELLGLDRVDQLEGPPSGGWVGEAGLQLLNDRGFGTREDRAPERSVFEGPEADGALVAGDDLESQPEGGPEDVCVFAREEGFAVGEGLVAVDLQADGGEQGAFLLAWDDEELGHIPVELVPG
jgi:hypothetical protein